MSKNNQLDFIVIGAAKSATTTLHELLKEHPDIFIPAVKEVPFFSENNVYEKGIDYYFKKFFSGAEPGQKLGTVTPQYMIDHPNLDTKQIAQRIHTHSPNIKIIAILRDPVERAFSHYTMQLQRGHEARSFDDIIADALVGSGHLQKIHDLNKSYIPSSEYGRILSNYYGVFPRKNILVLTTDELKANPVETIHNICRFIGVSDNYRPRNPHKKSRVGGNEPRVKFLSPGFIYKVPYVKYLWKNYTPIPVRKKVEYTINLWNTKEGKSDLHKSDSRYTKLLQYFHDDTAVLEKVTGKKFPWNKTR